MPLQPSPWLFVLACGLGLALPVTAAEPNPASPAETARQAKSAPEPQTAADYVARAFRRVDAWQWPEALADANEALKIEPGAARAMLARGAANVGINAAAALRDLAAAEKLGEKSARWHCEQGLAYCALKRYDKALEAADRALQIDPKAARACALRGQALAAQKGLNAATADLEKAVALEPASAYGWGVRAEVIMDWDANLGPPPAEILQLKQLNPRHPPHKLPFIMAMRPLRTAIQLAPDNPRYYFDRARAFVELGDGDQGLRDLDRAIALSSTFFRAYYLRMHVKVAMGDLKGGDADAVRMIQLDPSQYVGHHAHGYYMVMTGNEEAGLKEIDLAIQSDPEHAIKDYLVRALTRLKQYHPSEAVADATKALEINPRNPDAHYLRARAFLQLQEWKRAVADLDVMIRIAPEVVEHWTWRAEAKMRLEDYRGAVADYDQALKLSPHFPAASFPRGGCRMQLKDFEGAAADFRDALAHGIERETFEGNCPGHAAAHRGLGEVFLEQHKPQEARAEFDRALAIYPRDAFALIRRGEAKNQLHDCRGAIEDFSRAIQNNPGDCRAYIGRGLSKHELRDYAGALADFDAALRVSPAVANAFAGRGKVKLAMDDCAGALADLDTAIRQARLEAGEATDDSAAAAQPPAASAVAEELSTADAGNPFGYLLGHERDAGVSPTGELPRSVLSDIYHDRGLAYFEMAQYAKAIKNYDQAFRIWPPTEPGLMTRAHAKGQLGDLAGLLADTKAALAVNPQCPWATCDRAMLASLGGDFAGALALFARLVEDSPTASGPHLCRGILLAVLGERKLAMADYRETLVKDRGSAVTWNADQAALAIWTLRSLHAERDEADQELRKHFAGRTPDLKDNWYGRLADFLLDRHGDEARLARDAQSQERSRRPWRRASVYYYLSVRRKLAGDKPGALEMLKKAAATNAVTELQWYECELRLRIASGKIPAPQQPEAGKWRDSLPAAAKDVPDR